MSPRKPIIALDVDGVLSPILKDEDFETDDFYRWDLAEWNWPNRASEDASFEEISESSPWVKTDCMEAYVAKPVTDFFRKVHETGRAEVMWHSTWGVSAKNFEEALNLPSFEVLFGRYSGSARSGGDSRWEKLIDVEALLEQGERVVWLDDHIVRSEETAEVLDDPRLFWIAPGPKDIVGLSPSDLAVIDKVLSLWEKLPE